MTPIFFKNMKFLSGIKNIKNRLTHLGKKEPLSFFSIFVVLCLDLFVLINLFQGLDLQTRQLNSPSEVIPYQCLSLVKQPTTEKAKESAILDILSGRNAYYYETQNKYSADFVNQQNKEKISVQCREVFDSALLVANEKDLEQIHNEIQGLERRESSLDSEIRNYERNYDTMLLEDIADQPDQNSITNGNTKSIKNEIEIRKNKISTINNSINGLQKKIMNSPEVEKYFVIVDQNRESILEQNKSLQFWFPLKKTAVEFLFLLPLLLFAFFFYRRSVQKDQELLVLIFSHLLVVISIPITFEIIRLLLDILPFHILADLIELLEALNLVGIWNYILILLGISIALGVIFIVQKKLFSREKIYLKRIAQNKCTDCGTKLRGEKEYCYKCGSIQIKSCPHCQKKTHAHGIYCIHCGKNLKDEEK